MDKPISTSIIILKYMFYLEFYTCVKEEDKEGK